MNIKELANWAVYHKGDNRSPFEIGTASPIAPGATLPAMVAIVRSTFPNAHKTARLISMLPEIVKALDILVAAEEEYGDPNNVAVNEGWLQAKEMIKRIESV